MSPCIQLANRDCVPKADTLLPVTDSTSPRPLPLAASRVWANSASICAFNSAARASLPKIRAKVSICFSPLVRILPLSTVRSMVVAFSPTVHTLPRPPAGNDKLRIVAVQGFVIGLEQRPYRCRLVKCRLQIIHAHRRSGCAHIHAQLGQRIQRRPVVHGDAFGILRHNGIAPRGRHGQRGGRCGCGGYSFSAAGSGEQAVSRTAQAAQ